MADIANVDIDSIIERLLEGKRKAICLRHTVSFRYPDND